jgi:hypothetical protein
VILFLWDSRARRRQRRGVNRGVGYEVTLAAKDSSSEVFYTMMSE